MSSASTHTAAMATGQGQPLSVESRPTPKPQYDEILIEVRNVALNPVDYIQRDQGFMVAQWPSVLGSDIAGTVVSTGPGVPADSPFQPGARVAGFASAFYKKGAPDYGGLQQRVVVPTANLAPLPDGWSFEQGALLGMAVGTTFAALHTLGIPRDTQHAPADKKVLLVWGASSSMGAAMVQVATLMGFVVYATASPKHHAMVKKLGAAKVFDYKEADVVEQIVAAAQADGAAIDQGYAAVPGSQEPSTQVLVRAKGVEKARLASAPQGVESVPGVDVAFTLPPADEAARQEYYGWVFNTWLPAKLQSGEFVPSPNIRKVEGGLAKANEALEILKGGVSGEKLVLDV